MRYCNPGCMIICLLMSISLQSQFYFSSNYKREPAVLWELGGSAGVMNCLTDIGGRSGAGKKFIKDINWDQTRFCGSLFVNASWQSKYAIRLEATMGEVTGSDDVLKTTTSVARNRYLRHLHFKTSVIELAATTEWHLLPILFKDRESVLLSPYLVAGLGFFHYNPQAKLNDVWIDLRPLHTEGQGFKEYPEHGAYKPFSWCMPVGAGIKYDASGLIMIRLEILYRFTGTDYIDDVSSSYIDPSLFSKYLSPFEAALAAKLNDRSGELIAGVKNDNYAIRGNPSNKDAFFSFSFKISMALGRNK